MLNFDCKALNELSDDNIWDNIIIYHDENDDDLKILSSNSIRNADSNSIILILLS